MMMERSPDYLLAWDEEAVALIDDLLETLARYGVLGPYDRYWLKVEVEMRARARWALRVTPMHVADCMLRMLD